jgi:hypothetical protein
MGPDYNIRRMDLCTVAEGKQYFYSLIPSHIFQLTYSIISIINTIMLAMAKKHPLTWESIDEK